MKRHHTEKAGPITVPHGTILDTVRKAKAAGQRFKWPGYGLRNRKQRELDKLNAT